jgi:hypothetical protein
LRTQVVVLAIYRWVARVALPAFFLFVCVVGVVAGIHHMALALLGNGGYFCEDGSSLQSADEADRSFTFKTDALCQKSGVSVTEGQRYRVTVTIPPDDDWFDRSIWTDARGFPTDRPTHYGGMLIKRWWTKNWFQPIVRVGRRGNYEYALEPVEPLPDVPLQDCAAPAEENADTSQPASPEIRQAVKQCGGQTLIPSRKLVAEFTPRKSGELFVYVNDAVLLWPGMVKYFYGNNSGSAQVTVAPVLAPAVISR